MKTLEQRVRGHVALCVLAATIEAVMAGDLAHAEVMDPALPFQHMTPRRALGLLKEVRVQPISAGERRIKLVIRRNALQAKVLKAFGVDTSAWGKAEIAWSDRDGPLRLHPLDMKLVVGRLPTPKGLLVL